MGTGWMPQKKAAAISISGVRTVHAHASALDVHCPVFVLGIVWGWGQCPAKSDTCA